MAYTIVRHPWPTPSQATAAPTRRTLEAAFADMGEGAVFEDGRLVAFHERHLPALERRAAAPALHTSTDDMRSPR